MNSLLIPNDVQISIGTSFLYIKGPRGSFLTPTGGYTFRILSTPEGSRLFVFSAKSINGSFDLPLQTVLTLRSRRRQGLSTGYRRRLRLVGVGFRATVSSDSSKSSELLSLKLGYSHEISIPQSSRAQYGVSAIPSRLDGRTKGTLIHVEGSDPSLLNHQVAQIQSLRRPDPYKAKGIHREGQTIRRKKGKRDA